MRKKVPGFIFDIKKPTRKRSCACLAVTPKEPKGKAVVSAKVERDFGRDKCIKFAHEFLELAGAPQNLLNQVAALAPGLKKPIKA